MAKPNKGKIKVKNLLLNILPMFLYLEADLFVSQNTVVMSNGQLDWNNPDTFTAMLDR